MRGHPGSRCLPRLPRPPSAMWRVNRESQLLVIMPGGPLCYMKSRGGLYSLASIETVDRALFLGFSLMEPMPVAAQSPDPTRRGDTPYAHALSPELEGPARPRRSRGVGLCHQLHPGAGCEPRAYNGDAMSRWRGAANPYSADRDWLFDTDYGRYGRPRLAGVSTALYL